MPLKRGSSKKTVSSNIEELHTGKTYSRTEAKFGKAKADHGPIDVLVNNAGITTRLGLTCHCSRRDPGMKLLVRARQRLSERVRPGSTRRSGRSVRPHREQRL